MTIHSNGTIAVIFSARQRGVDTAGYADAAARMAALAKLQDGFVGMDSVRGEDGWGITVSYWTGEDAAANWRDNAEHTAIRNAGRNKWYSEYSIHIAKIERSYDWQLE